MEAEFGYRTENDNTRNVDAAQKADGRGATAGTQRDGHGAELERAARNAGQAVSAADAVERGSENAPDEAGSTERFDRDADERRKVSVKWVEKWTDSTSAVHFKSGVLL